MTDSTEYVSQIRTISMGLTGLVCLGFAGLVLLTGNPHPFSPWAPGIVGVCAAIVIFLAFQFGGRNVAEKATDEMYVIQNFRALRIGYWTALILYPLFGALLYNDIIPWVLALPAMGTLTAAAYLIPFAYLTGKNA